MKVRQLAWMLLMTILCTACKPDGPPPDLIKTQRQALEKSKALEGQMQQQAQDRMKPADEERN